MLGNIAEITSELVVSITPVMYSDISGYAPKLIDYIPNKISRKIVEVIMCYEDMKSIFHSNSSALVYKDGVGLGGTLLDTGLYYTEGFSGYYLDGVNKYKIVNGQKINLVIFSYTAMELENGEWIGDAGPSFGPLSFEDLGVEGGVVYNAGINYSINIIDLIEDMYDYITKEDELI